MKYLLGEDNQNKTS